MQKDKKSNLRCFNCRFAGPPFKIAGVTHYICEHPSHVEKEKSNPGEVSPFEMLMEFWNTCDMHELKEANEPQTN